MTTPDTVSEIPSGELSALFRQSLDEVSALEALEALRVCWTGRNGVLTQRLKQLGQKPPEERVREGQSLNTLRDEIACLLEDRKAALESAARDARIRAETLDMTRPPVPSETGMLHPLTQALQELQDLCIHLGLNPAQGPDIEHEDINFTHLNMPPLHPARSMHDTFYIADHPGLLLRTHTSSVQVRALHHPGRERGAPLRMFSAGRTYRSDWDATHTPMFHQVDGVWVDDKAHMGHLKGFLETLLKTFFQMDDLPIRFRPSFFPFTEPGAEVDIGYRMDKGQRRPGGGEGWMEILGCGMIHPRVLVAAGDDPGRVQGWAFGMGVERLAMLKYGISDMRRCYDSHIPWTRHTGFTPEAWKARS
jgi:phenylalanyl-tRNA synthetase alpha chain